jgi:hypothetical protein
MTGSIVRAVAQRCERPGCGEPASVSYGFDSERITVWLEALRPDGPSAGALCRRHAEAMVLPRGWWLQDRRSDAALFAAPEPPPSTQLYRPRRPRRRPSPPPPLPLAEDRLEDAAPAEAVPIHPDPSAAAADQVLAETAAPLGAGATTWSPAFEPGDDLDGLLDAKTPLLSRAFGRATPRPTPER